MEQSISSLAFRGSILEAITEAKRQKKLFVVYISASSKTSKNVDAFLSVEFWLVMRIKLHTRDVTPPTRVVERPGVVTGDNEDSVSMDKSTWSESSVAESLSKYCILLHILEGSTDAAQFSALYPQKSAPCITAIGYNGVQLWQNEGFVSAEVLASTFEKAWLSLHVQETTATFLTAALASRQSEQIPSEAPHTASREIGSSSSASSTNTNVTASVDKKNIDHDKEQSENCAPLVEEINSKLGDDVSHGPFVDKLEESNVEQPDTTTRESVNQVTVSAIDSRVDKNLSLDVNQHVGDSVEAPRVVDDEAKPQKSGSLQIEKVDNSELASNKSSDIHLNIRLPGGASLQENFQPTSTLSMVKDYVDEKQESSIGSYDLAIPYPRKVFGDQDLSKTLAELSLLDRQALIVVPRLQATGHHKGRSSIPNPSVPMSATGSSDGEGYFSLVKRVLSYVNPLAYLGGSGAANSSTSLQESGRSLPESGSTPQSNFTGSRRSYLVTPNQSRPSSSRFGSNIHTLKHDEDDSKFRGKNAFWNGNSTEYGGDGDK